MDGFLKEKSVFTTSASLIDSLDKRMLVMLRDGRKLLGVLRSYDQFANLVLQDTIERVYIGDAYGDIVRGVYIVRGENVVLMGEIDEDIEEDLPLRKVPIEEILHVQKMDHDMRLKSEKARNKILFSKGFSVDFEKNDFY
ncbi:U6 snRNA-associated Sm-like protein LSm1 [Conidiobolus coronatus NRRL 28638]|jgi:U6 snRNA-associated Sm-like protein LSm1|uniref:U6 snRNA-associated Sm-like protein LSm1 n=1 Tax=Conidiobolus coronatus (strain ATCC 28846 / CBS 209.66 / NRRL 28638) TaxID=796925 RepID=A0A137PEH0_CONC2|nr:U6 snRNA-associated Sm-like protein LSm1 [Conidiobolus coronatus NRRL 28638]|eukprot:KXN73406.1 U6 snRNA-associated Sm-like protein LSm1 [Conidiobolus coronatus NRRL 28638]